jgi:hypothetical protein
MSRRCWNRSCPTKPWRYPTRGIRLPRCWSGEVLRCPPGPMRTSRRGHCRSSARARRDPARRASATPDADTTIVGAGMTDAHPDTTAVIGAVATPGAYVSTHSSGPATTAARSPATAGSAATAGSTATASAAPAAFSKGGCNCQKDDGQGGYESTTELHRVRLLGRKNGPHHSCQALVGQKIAQDANARGSVREEISGPRRRRPTTQGVRGAGRG